MEIRSNWVLLFAKFKNVRDRRSSLEFLQSLKDDLQRTFNQLPNDYIRCGFINACFVFLSSLPRTCWLKTGTNDGNQPYKRMPPCYILTWSVVIHFIFCQHLHVSVFWYYLFNMIRKIENVIIDIVLNKDNQETHLLSGSYDFFQWHQFYNSI
jgi:hypothetical protein